MAKGYLYDNGDELISREDVNEVPEGSSAHAGDVLALDSNKKPKWTTPESGLPGTGTASAGDVLSLDSDKEPVWSTPSGGGGYYYIDVTTVMTNDGATFTTTESYNSLLSKLEDGQTVVFRSSFQKTLLSGATSKEFFEMAVCYFETGENGGTTYYDVETSDIYSKSFGYAYAESADPDTGLTFVLNNK